MTEIRLGNLIYNTDWTADCESPWSVMEKLKYANGVFVNDVLSTVHGVKPSELLKSKRTFARFEYTSENDIVFGWMTPLLGENPKKRMKMKFQFDYYHPSLLINEDNKQRYHRISNREKSHLTLRFCPECLSHGYHGEFHQDKQIKRCPLHYKELLTTECPECGAIKPLEFENTKLMGFHCKCGHCFLKENYPLKNMQLWRKFSNDHKNLFIKLLGKNTNIYTDINDWSFNRGFTYTSFDRKKLIDDILQNDRSVRYASRVCIVRGPILPFIHKENNNLTIDDYEEYHKQKTYKTYATVADEIRSVFYRKLQEYYKEHRKCCVRRDNCFVKKAIATWKGKVFDGHKKFDPRKEERSKLSYDERREQGIKNWEVEYPYIDNGFFRDMVFQYNYPDKEWYYRHILWLRCWDGLIPFLGGGWGYSDDETPIIHRLDRLSDKNFRATMAYSTKRITEAINFIRTSC